MLQETLNLAAEGDYQKILGFFGGEKSLSQKYPHILQMLKDTREWKLSKNDEEIPDGYQDSFRILAVPLSPEGSVNIGLFTESSMSLVNQSEMAMMIGKVYDSSSGKVFASFSDSDENVYNMVKRSLIDHSLVAYADNLKVMAETQFLSVSKVNGKSILNNDPVISRLAIDLNTVKPLVETVSVIQPKEKDGAEYIRVVYNDRHDDEAAYNFKCAKDHYHGGIRYVDVYYPFQVKIKLAGDGSIITFDDEAISVEDSYITILSDVVKGGKVHFNTALMSKISWKRIDDCTALIDFGYDSATEMNYWGVQMPLTAEQDEGYFEFHLNFPIHLKTKSGDKLTTVIVVTSEDIPKSENMVKIKKSSILWGCIGENALIMTQDGDKLVQDLRVGDMIYTEQGYKRLVNIVTGNEPEMISVTVSNHEKLLLTPNHPVVAERKVLAAKELSSDDRIRLSDGSYAHIIALEQIPYRGKVYSLELEQSEMIFANGLMVGDYRMLSCTQKSDNVITNDATEQSDSLSNSDPVLYKELLMWMEEVNVNATSKSMKTEGESV